MGESTTFHCESCGYRSATVRWGVSASNPRRRFLPAHCAHCREYVEIDITGADILVDVICCPICGEEVFFIDRAESYRCPRCEGPGLKLTQGPAYW